MLAGADTRAGAGGAGGFYSKVDGPGAEPIAPQGDTPVRITHFRVGGRRAAQLNARSALLQQGRPAPRGKHARSRAERSRRDVVERPSGVGPIPYLSESDDGLEG